MRGKAEVVYGIVWGGLLYHKHNVTPAPYSGAFHKYSLWSRIARK
jgi:hypothetical protein